MWKNSSFRTIQEVKDGFYEYLETHPLAKQIKLPEVTQLDTAFNKINSYHFKLLHPLFIKGYKNPMPRFSETPIQVIGLDVETDIKTGDPKLLGLWFPDPIETYTVTFNPKLENLFDLIFQLSNNASQYQIVTWGNLDIQTLLKLFDPTEEERNMVSRGISANVKQGKFIGTPPILRTVKDTPFYVGHYISGRSLRLGYIHKGREYSRWVYNISQFYPGLIRENAIGLGLPWRDFPKDTHLVDWHRYVTNKHYQNLVQLSNKQDAQTVQLLTANLQERFHAVFHCYPTLLVSNGSLTDTAVSKLLSSNKEDYQANSWKWLAENVWDDDPDTADNAERLLTEAFSAGYVDQFAMGYFPKVFQADIASAYPAIIRALPDLRFSELLSGEGNLDADLESLRAKGRDIETAIIEGHVVIPKSLRFHPITLKTFKRENFRPTGTFYAAYTLEEREFCRQHGATFTEENYVIVALKKRVVSPLATVSQTLGDYRARVNAELAKEKDADRRLMLDGQQFVIKVIDNALYGKTVQTVEVVEDVQGIPQITGYVTGDRFNLLYGTLIAARTRIKVAKACASIIVNMGQPIMCMTDAVTWIGPENALAEKFIRSEKTPGYFESPVLLEDFFILKTGQYEYRKGAQWVYKMRGLNVDYDLLNGKESFYRKLIKAHTAKLRSFVSPKDIKIPVPSRKLVTIGSQDLEHLAMIQEMPIMLRPFVLSTKQTERSVTDWRKTLDGHIWLQTPTINPNDTLGSDYPLAYLNRLQDDNDELDKAISRAKRNQGSADRNDRQDVMKLRYITRCMNLTERLPPEGRSYRLPWEILLAHYGIERVQNELVWSEKE